MRTVKHIYTFHKESNKVVRKSHSLVEHIIIYIYICMLISYSLLQDFWDQTD